MQPLKNKGLALAVWGLYCGFCCASIQAQQDNLSDEEMRAEMALAVSQTDANLGRVQPSVKPRRDLEQLLAAVRENGSAKKVYFYQMDSAGDELGSPASSIEVVVHSTGAVNQLYSFEGSREIGAFAGEFNRLVSSLGLSVTRNDALSFAKLFLESSRAGHPGDILGDDVDLKLAVQNYYFSMYRDVWKMLDAYSRWYTPFEASMSQIGPKVVVKENGDYGLSLQTLLTMDGKHPQVQDIELDISPTGIVEVRDIRTIFPDQSRWVFYDFALPRPETFR